MNKLIPALLLLITCMATPGASTAQAQDTLPKFTVKNMGNNRIVIGWTNTFETIRQISIQRSFDSLKNYKTILTVPDPATPQNGYADTKATTDHMFYRLYILLDKGVYLFSDVKKPVWDSLIKRTATLDNRDFVFPVMPPDSSLNNQVVINNKAKAEAWTPSKSVYTFRDGYIRISLPEEEDKKYSIKFFTINDEPLFELKDIKEKNFKIDKANFYHAGWFKFELYEDGKLKEKNKFYLPREF